MKRLKDGVYRVNIHGILTYYILEQSVFYISRRKGKKFELIPTFLTDDRINQLREVTIHEMIEELEQVTTRKK